MNWEYMTLTQGTIDMDALDLKLSALGSLGWEAVGYMSMDRTIGLNAVSVLLKRQVRALDGDGGPEERWLADPSGRFEQRFWDGFRWTEHVSSGGVASTDFPNVRA